MTSKTREETESYDPRKREPQYAHADKSCLWELVSGTELISMRLSHITPQLPLLYHYHPSVGLHARQLLTHSQVTATADLGLNTLSHFLDRFVYRNPKKPRQKGASAMQPAAHDDEPGMVHAGKTALATDTIHPEQFKKKKEGDVPVDQVCVRWHGSDACANSYGFRCSSISSSRLRMRRSKRERINQTRGRRKVKMKKRWPSRVQVT